MIFEKMTVIPLVVTEKDIGQVLSLTTHVKTDRTERDGVKN